MKIIFIFSLFFLPCYFYSQPIQGGTPYSEGKKDAPANPDIYDDLDRDIRLINKARDIRLENDKTKQKNKELNRINKEIKYILNQREEEAYIAKIAAELKQKEIDSLNKEGVKDKKRISKLNAELDSLKSEQVDAWEKYERFKSKAESELQSFGKIIESLEKERIESRAKALENMNKVYFDREYPFIDQSKPEIKFPDEIFFELYYYPLPNKGNPSYFKAMVYINPYRERSIDKDVDFPVELTLRQEVSPNVLTYPIFYKNNPKVSIKMQDHFKRIEKNRLYFITVKVENEKIFESPPFMFK